MHRLPTSSRSVAAGRQDIRGLHLQARQKDEMLRRIQKLCLVRPGFVRSSVKEDP